jgi:hypothetical protein
MTCNDLPPAVMPVAMLVSRPLGRNRAEKQSSEGRRHPPLVRRPGPERQHRPDPRPPTCSTGSTRRARLIPAASVDRASPTGQSSSSMWAGIPLHPAQSGPAPRPRTSHSWTNCAGPTGDQHNRIPQLHGSASPMTSRGSKASYSGPTPARHVADRNDRWLRRSGCRARPRAPLPVRSPRPPADRTRSTARGRPTRRHRLSIPRRTCGKRGSATGRPV